MSFIKPDHTYKCVVTSSEMPTAEKWPVAVNGNRVEIPLGDVVEVSGLHLRALQDASYEKPVTKINELGQKKIVGYRSVPRFNVQIYEDLTLNQQIGAAPVGEGYVIDKKHAMGQKEKKEDVDMEQDLTEIPFLELRKMAFNLGIGNVNNMKKNDLIRAIEKKRLEKEQG